MEERTEEERVEERGLQEEEKEGSEEEGGWGRTGWRGKRKGTGGRGFDKPRQNRLDARQRFRQTDFRRTDQRRTFPMRIPILDSRTLWALGEKRKACSFIQKRRQEPSDDEPYQGAVDGLQHLQAWILRVYLRLFFLARQVLFGSWFLMMAVLKVLFFFLFSPFSWFGFFFILISSKFLTDPIATLSNDESTSSHRHFLWGFPLQSGSERGLI